LARAGKYDSVVFHRVIEGFMAQTGDVEHGVLGNPSGGTPGTGGSDLPNLVSEYNSEPHVEGIVSMASTSAPNSANSQFFIMFADAQHLDGGYTVFGRVVSGMETVHAIKKGTGRGGSVAEPDHMVSVRVKADL